MLLLQELQPGPQDGAEIAGVVVTGAISVAAGIAGLPQVIAGVAVAQERPNQLHCRQPAVPPTIASTIAKTDKSFINVVSYRGWIRLHAYKSTEQLYTTT